MFLWHTSPIVILSQAVNLSCLALRAFCKSVWSDNVQVMFHHSALVCVLEITLLAEIDIQGPAVYVVSVALSSQLVPQERLAHNVRASCFQLQVVLSQVLSARSFISKSQATYVVSVAEIVRSHLCMRH